MSLNLEQKQAVVAEVATIVADAKAACVAEYRGLTVAQMTELRKKARASDVYVRVVKNTLLKRAIGDSALTPLKDHLSGPLVFAASKDPVAIAKIVSEFAKANERFRLKTSVMDGKLITSAEVQALAKLPGREQLLAMLMGAMQAPAQKFVQTLNEVPARFVRTLAAVRDARAKAA